MRVLGYVRVSTEEQANNGAGLEAQRSAIVAECERRGWELLRIEEDAGYSAKNLKRPAIQAALAALKAKEADALMVAKLDRLSRSMLDFAGIMESAKHFGWGVVALDVNVDTTTPAGEMVANVMATFAQFERRLIGQRTRDALAEKRKQGVRLGRPCSLDPTVAQWIVAARKEGLTLSAIADTLNREGVPTAHGGRQWWPSSVRGVLERVA